MQHKCSEEAEFNLIPPDDRDKNWYLGLDGSYTIVKFCPYCGACLGEKQEETIQMTLLDYSETDEGSIAELRTTLETYCPQ